MKEVSTSTSTGPQDDRLVKRVLKRRKKKDRDESKERKREQARSDLISKLPPEFRPAESSTPGVVSCGYGDWKGPLGELGAHKAAAHPRARKLSWSERRRKEEEEA